MPKIMGLGKVDCSCLGAATGSLMDDPFSGTRAQHARAASAALRKLRSRSRRAGSGGRSGTSCSAALNDLQTAARAVAEAHWSGRGVKQARAALVRARARVKKRCR